MVLTIKQSDSDTGAIPVPLYSISVFQVHWVNSWVFGRSSRMRRMHIPLLRLSPWPRQKHTLLAGISRKPQREFLFESCYSMVCHCLHPEFILMSPVISVFMITLLVPSNDPMLLRSSGTAAQSPFLIAATRAGVKVVPHIINAIVLSSAWSSGNSSKLLS